MFGDIPPFFSPFPYGPTPSSGTASTKFVDLFNTQSVAGAKTWTGAATFSAGWSAGASSVLTPGSLFRDANAGDSTNIVQLKVGNSGSNQGEVDLRFVNAAASGAPGAYLVFFPRNNAGTTNFQGGVLSWLKNAGVDNADMNLQTGSARLYQEGGTGHTGVNTNAPSAEWDVAGDIQVKTAGKGYKIAEGANATMGQATLVAGTVTVNTTAVTANSRIILTRAVGGGTRGYLEVGTITAATSFVINSTDGAGAAVADTSTINWIIFKPAA